VLAGLGVIAFKKAAMAEFGPGHTHDDDAVHDQRCPGHRVTIGRGRRLGRFRLPDFLAGLGVERDEPVIHERADDHALVDRRAAIDDAAADDAQRLRRIVVLDPPDLLARQGVDGCRGVVGRDIDDAVVDDRKAFAALQIGERIRPHWYQSADAVLVDLRQRAEPVPGIAHPVYQHVVRRFLVVLQIVGVLREHR
jgi:hypothetical protein